MKNKIYLGMFALIVLMFGSCAKDGATGPAGAAGKDGTNGTNGNANVTGSNTVTLNNWVSDYNDGTDFGFHSDATWSGITQVIVDKGVIMVYVSDDNGGWIALPTTESGTGYSATIGFQFSVGSVSIFINGYDDSGSTVAADFNGTVIRVVAIAASNRVDNPNVNLSNYEEVKKAFNLKD